MFSIRQMSGPFLSEHTDFPPQSQAVRFNPVAGFQCRVPSCHAVAGRGSMPACDSGSPRHTSGYHATCSKPLPPQQLPWDWPGEQVPRRASLRVKAGQLGVGVRTALLLTSSNPDLC